MPDEPNVKKLDENSFDRMIEEEPKYVQKFGEPRVRKKPDPKVSVVDRRVGRRKKDGPRIRDLQLVSIYVEPEMWRDMKWMAQRIGVGSRSGLVRMLITRLKTRIEQADLARETAEKNLRAVEEKP